MPSKRRDKLEAKKRRDTLEAALASLNLSDVGRTVDQHVFLEDLEEGPRAAVDAYLRCAFQGMEELPALISRVSEIDRTAVRIKELLESVEVAKHAVNFALLAAKGRPVDVLYDLACGHGLVGVLCAYRFPRKEVVCVDLERRCAFDTFLAAWREMGEKAPGEDHCLSNLSFVEGDLRAVAIRPHAVVVAIHACNEANREVIEAAQAAQAAWFVMPCCIRKGVYLPYGIRGESEHGNGLDDAAHLLRCGVVAGRFGAQRVDSVDRRITNRHVFLQGGLSEGIDGRAPGINGPIPTPADPPSSPNDALLKSPPQPQTSLSVAAKPWQPPRETRSPRVTVVLSPRSASRSELSKHKDSRLRRLNRRQRRSSQSANREAAVPISHIDAAELALWLRSGASVLVLDLRPWSERIGGYVRGSVHLPYTELEGAAGTSVLAAAVVDSPETIVCVCMFGLKRSKDAGARIATLLSRGRDEFGVAASTIPKIAALCGGFQGFVNQHRDIVEGFNESLWDSHGKKLIWMQNSLRQAAKRVQGVAFSTVL